MISRKAVFCTIFSLVFLSACSVKKVNEPNNFGSHYKFSLGIEEKVERDTLEWKYQIRQPNMQEKETKYEK